MTPNRIVSPPNNALMMRVAETPFFFVIRSARTRKLTADRRENPSSSEPA